MLVFGQTRDECLVDAIHQMIPRDTGPRYEVGNQRHAPFLAGLAGDANGGNPGDLQRWLKQIAARPAAQKGIAVPYEIKTIDHGKGDGAEQFAIEIRKIVQR
jgi:hypothetical protein